MRLMYAGLVLLFLSFSVSRTAEAFSGQYEQTISVGDTVIAEFRVTAKDDNVRTEFLRDDQSEVIVKNSEGVFRYMPDQKVALKLPDVEEKENLLDDLDRYMEFLEEQGAEKTGSENLRGYETDIYQFTDPLTNQSARAWVWVEKEFPIKIEVDAPEGLLTIDLTRIDLDSEVSDDVFRLPEGAQVVNLEDVIAQNAAAEDGGEAVPKAEAAAGSKE